LADHNNNRQLMSLFRGAGWLGRLALLLPVLAGGLLVVQTWLLASVLHRAVAEHVPLDALLFPIAIMLGTAAGRAALNGAGEVCATQASEAIKRSLRHQLFATLMARQPLWTAARASGGLSTLVIEQVEALDGFFARYLPAMLQAAILPIAFAAVMLPLDWMVALLFLVTAPLIPVFMALAGWGAQAASDAQAGALGRLAGRFSDRLRGMVTLKLFGREAAETEAMFAASEELRRRSMKVMRIAFLSSAVLEFFAALGVAGVALYCGLSLLGLIHLRAVPLSLETALFCLIMAPEVYQPLRLLAAHYHDRANAKAALKEIEATIGKWGDEAEATQTNARVLRDQPAQPMTVALHGLSLTTSTGAVVLSDVELAFGRGTHVAIVGPSGIGKSTLVEAVARMRDYTGEIRLDGCSLDEFSEAELRQRVAFIGQRPHLFAGTIADNIRLGRPDACHTAIQAAAKRALVTRFAEALPLGLETPVGEGGLGLSGGEAQRVALARLFLRDPGLILLDEPTAHLDPSTEDEVLEQLLIFSRGRTMIVATHALTLARRMDKVYRLIDGQLVEALTPRQAGPARRLRGAA